MGRLVTADEVAAGDRVPGQPGGGVGHRHGAGDRRRHGRPADQAAVVTDASLAAAAPPRPVAGRRSPSSPSAARPSATCSPRSPTRQPGRPWMLPGTAASGPSTPPRTMASACPSVASAQALRHRPRRRVRRSRRRSAGCLSRPRRPHGRDDRRLRGRGCQSPACSTYSADGVRRSLEDSLDRLGLDQVDIALIHDPDEHGEPGTAGGVSGAGATARRGRVGAIGVGMNQAEMLTRFVTETDVDVVLIAGRYTLLDQSAADGTAARRAGPGRRGHCRRRVQFRPPRGAGRRRDV